MAVSEGVNVLFVVASLVPKGAGRGNSAGFPAAEGVGVNAEALSSFPDAQSA